jgi:hypothetical protein
MTLLVKTDWANLIRPAIGVNPAQRRKIREIRNQKC